MSYIKTNELETLCGRASDAAGLFCDAVRKPGEPDEAYRPRVDAATTKPTSLYVIKVGVPTGGFSVNRLSSESVAATAISYYDGPIVVRAGLSSLEAFAEAIRLPAAIEYAKVLWRGYNPHCEVVGWDRKGDTVLVWVRLGRHKQTIRLLADVDEDGVEFLVERAWRNVACEAAKEWRPVR